MTVVVVVELPLPLLLCLLLLLLRVGGVAGEGEMAELTSSLPITGLEEEEEDEALDFSDLRFL